MALLLAVFNLYLPCPSSRPSFPALTPLAYRREPVPKHKRFGPLLPCCSNPGQGETRADPPCRPGGDGSAPVRRHRPAARGGPRPTAKDGHEHEQPFSGRCGAVRCGEVRCCMFAKVSPHVIGKLVSRAGVAWKGQGARVEGGRWRGAGGGGVALKP